MAPLRYAAKFDPFLALDCAPTPSTLVQSKEGKGQNFAIWQPCFQGQMGRKSSSSTPGPDQVRVTVPTNPNCSIDLDLASPRYLPLFLSRATGEFLLPSPEKSGRDVRRILSLEGDGGNGDIVALCPGAKLKPTNAVSREAIQ